MMENDYLLIGVDSEKRFAIRFLWLKYGAEESLAIKGLPSVIQEPYLKFLLGSILLGSRASDQEAVLYKLHFLPSNLWMNSEVNTLGAFRTAVFPTENRAAFSEAFHGTLQVSILNKKDQVYTSSIEISPNDISKTWNDYLENSIQTPSILLIHTDSQNLNKNYALWIEKLPGTSQEDWQEIEKRFESQSFFNEQVQKTDDPDVMMGHLFPFPIQILAVTKPKITCSCNLEAFERALTALPNEDLVELFLEEKGVESQCDYCGKVWRVEDSFIRNLIQSTRQVQ